jgi:hypothetical protein
MPLLKGVAYNGCGFEKSRPDAFRLRFSQFLWAALGQRQNGLANLMQCRSFYERLTMKRYFFDFVGRHSCEYDCCGRDLPTAEHAHELAELIALDLGIEEDDGWTGWSVNDAMPRGREFFSVPVQSSCLAAA